MVKTDFNTADFGGFTEEDIHKALDGRLATCKECCSQRVIISRARGEQGPVWAVSCGSTSGCTHNIAGIDLPTVVNRWNEELVAEGDEEDFATEVAVHFL